MKFTATNGRRSVWTITTPGRPDWKAERERIDLAAVATRLLGPAPGRRGQRGRRLWWRCPLGTHEDGNPSFGVEPGKVRWRCYGCGESGDAAALVKRVLGSTFPEAVAYLTGGPSPPSRGGPRPAPAPRAAPAPPAPPGPEGMSPGDAAALVAEAAARLWSPEGAVALAYLTGPRRLTPEAIRAARLGYSPRVEARTKDGRAYTARGVVVPWFNSGRLTLAKVRQPDGCKPKYAEVYRDRARYTGIYPGPATVRPGRPLIVTEGEFDCLALGDAVGDLAAVVTLGSASARPEPVTLGRMVTAAPWYIATDRDEAGDKAAAGWPDCARRSRPPEPFKDWTEAKAGGVDLARWWRDVLAGNDRPALFTWENLAAWRWGPAADAPSPGIVNPGRPFDPETYARALAADPGPELEP